MASSRSPGRPTVPCLRLRDRPGPTVLTPHDGEYGLLAGRKPGPDRLAAARAGGGNGCGRPAEGTGDDRGRTGGRRAHLDRRRRAAGHGGDRGRAVRDRRRPAGPGGAGLQGRRGCSLVARQRGPAARSGAWSLGSAGAAAGRWSRCDGAAGRLPPAGVGGGGPGCHRRERGRAGRDRGAGRPLGGGEGRRLRPRRRRVPSALEAGAEGLCVALVQEGVALRQAGILAPVLVLSEQPEDQLDEPVRWRLTATAYTIGYLEALAHEARGRGCDRGAHIKVDTGMHRVGARTDEPVPLVQALLARPELRWGGLWTHRGRDKGVDNGDPARAARRRHRRAAGRRLPAAARPRCELRRRAGVGSGRAAISCGPASLSMASLQARGGGRCAGAQPALSLRGVPSSGVPPGEGISYGHRLVLDRETTIATLPSRYADGVPRRLGDVGGEVPSGYAPAHRRDGDDGSADGRLRRRRGGTGRRSRVDRGPGRRRDHRQRVGGEVGHDRLRGGHRASPRLPRHYEGEEPEPA